MAECEGPLGPAHTQPVQPQAARCQVIAHQSQCCVRLHCPSSFCSVRHSFGGKHRRRQHLSPLNWLKRSTQQTHSMCTASDTLLVLFARAITAPLPPEVRQTYSGCGPPDLPSGVGPLWRAGETAEALRHLTPMPPGSALGMYRSPHGPPPGDALEGEPPPSGAPGLYPATVSLKVPASMGFATATAPNPRGGGGLRSPRPKKFAVKLR